MGGALTSGSVHIGLNLEEFLDCFLVYVEVMSKSSIADYSWCLSVAGISNIRTIVITEHPYS